MYRCNRCQAVVPEKKPMKRITQYRFWTDGAGNQRKDITLEEPVCGLCLARHQEESTNGKPQTAKETNHVRTA